METICIKCQILFSGKNKKKISICLLLKILPSMLNVKYSRLPLSQIPRDSLKHFEISVLRHISVERVRKTIN